MCGIVVLLERGSVEERLESISHRGLDSQKIIQNDDCTIGFNRLAINDKSANGIQPFEYDDLVGCFNGEIYNSNELRQEFNLTTKSSSDIEVILPLFKKIGSSIIHYLDGFYSGLIYNKTTKQVYLLRDYIGKKPLFFVKNQNSKFIVSELKAVENHTSFQIIPKGFSELKNDEIQLRESHKIPFESKQNIQEVLIDAVRKRIPTTEKQFGVFLSGGLDSSIITSIVSKCTSNVIYYTLGNTNDLKFVDILSKELGIEKKIKVVNLPAPNELDNLIKKIVYHTESYNPSIISNGLATFLLSREAKKDGLKVVLTGEGADELFCGYKVTSDSGRWLDKRSEFIENMHFTECRRLDMASMANTIEIRCPFLDRKVYAISNDCTVDDLIHNNQGKQILRRAFDMDLPKEIVWRNKMSFDVGSGIRKMVVEHLTKDGLTEKEALKKIWDQDFQKDLSEHEYFHSYPTFNAVIAKRGITHENSILRKIEHLLLQEFRSVPFHNIFLLNSKSIVGTQLGGTCSDKVIHFRKVLSENGIESQLHSSFINEKECHRLLSVTISGQKYFLDPGSGWLNPKVIPTHRTIAYSIMGISYKTEINEDNLFLFHKTDGDFKLMIRIPLETKSETEILFDIENRFNNNIEYPFQSSLRFSKVIDNSFYFIKGDKLRIYNEKGIREQILSQSEIKKLLQNTFNFNLKNIDKWYTPNLR